MQHFKSGKKNTSVYLVDGVVSVLVPQFPDEDESLSGNLFRWVRDAGSCPAQVLNHFRIQDHLASPLRMARRGMFSMTDGHCLSSSRALLSWSYSQFC